MRERRIGGAARLLEHRMDHRVELRVDPFDAGDRGIHQLARGRALRAHERGEVEGVGHGGTGDRGRGTGACSVCEPCECAAGENVGSANVRGKGWLTEHMERRMREAMLTEGVAMRLPSTHAGSVTGGASRKRTGWCPRVGARLIAGAVVALVPLSPARSPLAAQSTPPATLTSPAPAPDWDEVARVIVERLQFNHRERVVLVVEPGTADPLVEALMRAIPKGGGELADLIPARGPTPQKWRRDYTRKAEQRPMLQLVEILRDADVGIMLPGATASDAPYKAFQYHLNRPAGRAVRTIHFHWSGAYSLSGDPIPVTPEIAALYQHALVDTDYDALALAERAFEAAMRSGPVRVTTPAGTDLTFRIGTRVVTRQDGDASRGGRARRERSSIGRSNSRQVQFASPRSRRVSTGRSPFPTVCGGGRR